MHACTKRQRSSPHWLDRVQTLGTPRNWRKGVWDPHIRWLTMRQRAWDLAARLAQPRRRHTSNRQRMSRPALCVTYTMSDASASPSSFSWLMNACNECPSWSTWPAVERHQFRHCCTSAGAIRMSSPGLHLGSEWDEHRLRMQNLIRA